MMQLIYRSRPALFTPPTLAGILVQARDNNARDGITGALFVRVDLYVQLIEGDEAAIERLYARLQADDRHTDVTVISTRTTGERLFTSWSMREDPKNGWAMAQPHLADAVLQGTDPDALLRAFEALARS